MIPTQGTEPIDLPSKTPLQLQINDCDLEEKRLACDFWEQQVIKMGSVKMSVIFLALWSVKFLMQEAEWYKFRVSSLSQG